MKCLVDSHAFLWFVQDDMRLPDGIRSFIIDPENDVRMSIATLWEIGLKHSLGKLPLKTDVLGLEAEARDLNIEIVPITAQAIHHVSLMPHHHKDPFDRIIAATALTTGTVLFTADPIFDAYGVARMW